MGIGAGTGSRAVGQMWVCLCAARTCLCVCTCLHVVLKVWANTPIIGGFYRRGDSSYTIHIITVKFIINALQVERDVHRLLHPAVVGRWRLVI